ncbi:MAG: mechanosensitive ion channel domain-containing protein [Bacteroidota bacterium]
MVAAGTYFSIHHLAFKEPITGVLDKIIFSAVVISVSVLAGRILVGFIKTKTSGTAGLLPSSSIIANVTRVIVFLVGILVILQTLGISVTPVLTALGVGGLAVALALQDTLSNLFSGIQVIASQQIRTGDYIKLDTGEEGYISDITWRNTTIRALPNNLIIVPNSKLASAIIRNYQLPDKEIAVLIEVSVSYDSDLEKVEQLTIQTAKDVLQKTEGGVKAFEPFIRYHTFADSSINFTTILRVQEFVNQYLVKHEFIKALHQQFRKNAVEIPFPIRTVHIRRGL